MRQPSPKSILNQNLRIYVLAVLCFLATVSSHAQEGDFNNDFETWFSVQVEKKMSKKLNVALSYAHRFDQNTSFQKSAFLEPELAYSFSKEIKSSLAYRYIVDPLDNSTEQRLISRSAYTYRLKPFKISYRLRLDHELGSNKIFDTFRNRLSFGYSRKKHKLSPKVSYEAIAANKNKGWLFNRWRLRFSTGYKISKRGKISLFYMVQRQINEAAPQQDFVLGLNFGYTLPKWKKKKKSELETKNAQ